MSSYNPSAKAGYTKSGKSLKSVRRYYALMNQQKSKSPEEDKLSKRIAHELKTQQDAIEKKIIREGGQPLLGDDTPTERSELPKVVVSPQETGPVFVAPPPAPPANKSASKANKTVKSARSLGALPELPTGMCSERCLFFVLGLLIGLVLGSLGAMVITHMLNKPARDT